MVLNNKINDAWDAYLEGDMIFHDLKYTLNEKEYFSFCEKFYPLAFSLRMPINDLNDMLETLETKYEIDHYGSFAKGYREKAFN